MVAAPRTLWSIVAALTLTTQVSASEATIQRTPELKFSLPRSESGLDRLRSVVSVLRELSKELDDHADSTGRPTATAKAVRRLNDRSPVLRKEAQGALFEPGGIVGRLRHDLGADVERPLSPRSSNLGDHERVTSGVRAERARRLADLLVGELAQGRWQRVQPNVTRKQARLRALSRLADDLDVARERLALFFDRTERAMPTTLSTPRLDRALGGRPRDVAETLDRVQQSILNVAEMHVEVLEGMSSVPRRGHTRLSDTSTTEPRNPAAKFSVNRQLIDSVLNTPGPGELSDIEQ